LDLSKSQPFGLVYISIIRKQIKPWHFPLPVSLYGCAITLIGTNRPKRYVRHRQLIVSLVESLTENKYTFWDILVLMIGENKLAEIEDRVVKIPLHPWTFIKAKL